MSFWYDIKHKNYTSDAKGSWIRAYVDKMLANIGTDTDSKFDSHFSGKIGRHTADTVDCNDGNTVQAKLDAEAATRLSADAAIRQEFTALDTAAKKNLSTEIQERKDADNLLSVRIDEEASARTNALNTKVDKIDGMKLSSNDYTDAEKSKLGGIESGAQVNSVTSVSGRTGAVKLSKTDVGLSNVDNTADADKPVSNATQTALAEKVDNDEFEEKLSLKADVSSVLTKTNTSAFTPTANYQPATKKYVDDNISAAGGGDMMKSVYDLDGDGIVDNSEKLGGQLPSYYAKKTEVDAKAPTSHATSTSTYGVGTSSAYGHVRLANNLTTTTTSGTALNAAQGKILNDKITALNDTVSSLLSTPPALTAVSPDGTAIGSDGWTGTGFFCTATNTKYAVSMTDGLLPHSIGGYNRFCLKPATDTEEWWNWTPFYTTDGVTYEFFYSPSRGVYETLIPPTSVSAATIANSVTWVRKPPVKLVYGKTSYFIGCYHKDATDTTEETDTYFLKEFNIDLLRCVIGDHYPCNEDRDTCNQFLAGNLETELSSLDLTKCILLGLMCDVYGSGLISMLQVSSLASIVSGDTSRYKILSIDNGFPGA